MIPIFDNPEFKRHIWLEISPARLWAMPLVILLIFLIVGPSYRTAIAMSEGFFIVLTAAWGSKLSGLVLIEEKRERTWDWQRMSSIRPWSLTWGKLFGGAIYAWYGGILCLFTLVLFGIGTLSISELIQKIVFMLSYAIFCQSFAFLLTLEASARDRERVRGFGMLPVVLMLLTLPYYIVISPLSGSQDQPLVSWYGFSFYLYPFTLASSLIFTAWTVIGAYRCMRVELQFKSLPIVWLSFLLFLCFYVSGFVHEFGLHAQLWLSFCLITAFWYMKVISEPKNIVTLRKFFQNIKSGNLLEAAYLFPMWGVCLCLSLLFLGAIILGPEQTYKSQFFFMPSIAVTLFLFALRDTFVVFYANLSTSRRWSGDGVALFYFVMLYMLIPGFIYSIGIPLPHFVFYPIAPHAYSRLAPVPCAVQCLILFRLLINRWKAAELR